MHGRVVLVDLTSNGRRTCRAARDRVGRVEKRLHAALGDPDYAEIRTQTWKLVDLLGGGVVSQTNHPMP